MRTSLIYFIACIFALIGLGIAFGAWTTLTTSQWATGQPVSQSLMQGVINNLNDLNTRVNGLSTSLSSQPKWACIVSWNSSKRCSWTVIYSWSMNNTDMHWAAWLLCAQQLNSAWISDYSPDWHCCMYSLEGDGKWWITNGYELPNSAGANPECDNRGWCRGAWECWQIQ